MYKRQTYVNGEFLPESEARISIFDRGFLFADAVYEVFSVVNGRLLDFPAHITRLQRSCGALNLPLHHDHDQLLALGREIIKRNHLREGLIYLQITRGTAERDFLFNQDEMMPGIAMFSQSKTVLENPIAKTGLSIITMEDKRWGRCDIKTVQLLYPSLAKMAAREKGADDTWFVKDGTITEGTSNNAYIITEDNVIVTRQLSDAILSGVTRAAILNYVHQTEIKLIERDFTVDEAYRAKEAFISSANTFVLPVVRIDDRKIGDGKVGPIATKLRALYIEQSIKNAL